MIEDIISFINSIENHTFAISIASAKGSNEVRTGHGFVKSKLPNNEEQAEKNDEKGFPIIYINKTFEKSFGYTLKEVVGKKADFLQKKIDNYDIINNIYINNEFISESLKKRKSCKVIIDNYKKNGTPFKNLIVLEPIIDKNNEYVYVLGFHCNVSENLPCVNFLMIYEDSIDLIVKQLKNIINK
jgi:PAS domain S-box-containing protein